MSTETATAAVESAIETMDISAKDTGDAKYEETATTAAAAAAATSSSSATAAAAVIHTGQHLIDIITDKIGNNFERFFSFEYYPPKTPAGVTALKQRLVRMQRWSPQWMDVTWGAGGTTSDLTPDIANHIQNVANGNCLMHLTCTNMAQEKVDVALCRAKKMGVNNILALRGDPPEGQAEWTAVEGGFQCALDLVRYIRQKYGDTFCITVSGYPEGHPLVRKKIQDPDWDPTTNQNPRYWAVQKVVSKSDDDDEEDYYIGVSPEDWQNELRYLKDKCDAGGQVIITQLFYDAQLFVNYVRELRAFGITAPVMPGIMPIGGYGIFHRMCGFCKTVIPADLAENLERLKETPRQLYEYGLRYVSEMCERLLDATTNADGSGTPLLPGLHFYTMNKEKATIDLLTRLSSRLFDDNVVKNPNLRALKNKIEAEHKRVHDELDRKVKEKILADANRITQEIKKTEFKQIQTF